MLGKRKRLARPDAELDITSFMNLMIVLVPVLLMMMVFSRITVVELALPGLESLGEGESIENQQIEVVVTNAGMAVYFPQGYLVKDIPLTVPADSADATQDYDSLQLTLRQIKQSLLAKNVDKKDLTLLVDDSVNYQSLISLLDTTRSYPDVVVASVVEAELFPQVSFADIPGDVDAIKARLQEASAVEAQ
ncbi:biopolymer transporter ExbD [Aliiglaciecola sp. CAU 1673]|uniref:ExbD/TolR family protein n=1 Tax=Aliiglaciecola sp. CAU 1673 TaxID=3032595 RepID=UPI0023DB30B9|nr:biopolymer transporter ExbD [Aliiglaciecola sp. CAU 1673]MDF2177852.1 biopolymer transporter ExbD [Aliiglaciecola sp. CAU 1673]